MSLKTDYKDEVWEGDREYVITDLGNGKSTIQDVTVPTVEGDQFGAKNINETNAAINRLNHDIDVTFPVSGWSESAPYTQTVPVEDITAEDKPSQGIVYPTDCTDAQRKAINKAVGCICNIETGNGTVTLTCTRKPIAEFTLSLKGV